MFERDPRKPEKNTMTLKFDQKHEFRYFACLPTKSFFSSFFGYKRIMFDGNLSYSYGTIN